MFILHLAATVQVGDLAMVRINGEPATVCWRDKYTLVINGNDARQIVAIEQGGIDGDGRPIVTFTCDDAPPTVIGWDLATGPDRSVKRGRCDTCGQERAHTAIVGNQRICDDCFYRLRDVPKA